MYIKCGALVQAQEVFDKILIKDITLWNLLLAGYANHGCEKEALKCFMEMQQEGIPSDAATCVCILKICSIRKDLGLGQEVHVKIIFQGLEVDCYVYNTLLDLYAKCNSIHDAQWIFDNLDAKCVVSWNALISGHNNCKNIKKSLQYLEQMKEEGFLPQAVTFVLSLKACGMACDINKGRHLHCEVSSLSLLGSNMFIGSAMIDMYAKCGDIVKSREVFDSLLSRNVVSWNSLITGYVECRFFEEALECTEQMQCEGVSQSNVTLVCSLKACGSIRSASKGHMLHTEIIKKGLEGELVISSALVDFYSKCGLLAEAKIMFEKYSMQDEIACTSLLTGYEENGYPEEALLCYEKMAGESVNLGAIILTCTLKACASMRDVNKGQEIYAEIARKGFFEKNVLVGSALVHMYAKCGHLNKAKEIFDELHDRDLVTWTTLMDGYLEHGNDKEALSCLEKMHQAGIPLDALTLVLGLKACTTIGAADEGQAIHAQIERLGLEQDTVIGSSIVAMYAKCGHLVDAWYVFNKLPATDVVSWGEIIAAYADLGESKCALDLFTLMLEEAVKPDPVLFVTVLNACSHGGCIDESEFYLLRMWTEHGIVPNFEHHICVIDLYCRAGQSEKAIFMIEKMPFHPSLVIWHAVLAACRRWGDVDFGKDAFDHAVDLDCEDVSIYVLMYNIYGDEGIHSRL
ncbi:hypothetical protein KP509_39G007300 [Ceratopteris richardii]|nr:hypothetical protein KP509_39G007300 [Ceratopteris richardii]